MILSDVVIVGCDFKFIVDVFGVGIVFVGVVRVFGVKCVRCWNFFNFVGVDVKYVILCE